VKVKVKKVNIPVTYLKSDLKLDLSEIKFRYPNSSIKSECKIIRNKNKFIKSGSKNKNILIQSKYYVVLINRQK